MLLERPITIYGGALSAPEVIMTEKVNGQGFRPTDMTGTTRRPDLSETSESTSSSKASATNTEDTVNVSRSSVLLSELEQVVSSLPVVDSARVDELKQAIASGTYEVDSSSVAERMMRLERELT